MDLCITPATPHIDGTEIMNVPLFTQFVQFSQLSVPGQGVLEQVLSDATPNHATREIPLPGQLFVHYRGPKRLNNSIPIELLLGNVIRLEGEVLTPGLYVRGNTRISFHDNRNPRIPSVVGFSTTDAVDLQHINAVSGCAISQERYDAIVRTLTDVDPNLLVPHPETKAFQRRSDTYLRLKRQCEAREFHELPTAMFRFGHESSEGYTLVAVHPYYLEYRKVNGKNQRLTDTQVKELMTAYDIMFREHPGPVVLIEEQSSAFRTIERLQALGRRAETYLVVSEDFSSSFPFTENEEFIWLLNQIGKPTKFIGGYDGRAQPYFDWDSGERYSGCLGGLIKCIEKCGFPKVVTIPGLVYS